MEGPLRLGRVSDCRQRLLQQFLEIGLAGVDDVVHRAGMAEAGRRGVLDGWTRCVLAGRPQRPSGALVAVRTVAEILAEQAEFPELVGDVLPDVGHCPIGPDNHLRPRLCVRVRAGVLVGVDRHHPAAGLLAGRLERDGPGGLEHVERRRPEIELQDVAFPAEQVVFDVEAIHRRQMQADDAVGDKAGDLGVGVAAMLQVAEHASPRLQPAAVRFIPCRHSGVQVPAVVVEAGAGGELADVLECPIL